MLDETSKDTQRAQVRSSDRTGRLEMECRHCHNKTAFSPAFKECVPCWTKLMKMRNTLRHGQPWELRAYP